MQAKLNLLDKMSYVRAVDALDADGPLVCVVHRHPARAVIGIDRDRYVAVDNRTIDADSLQLAAPTEGKSENL